MQPQLVRLLARLKLDAKKNLQINVDVESMPQDAAYADYVLKTIETRATDHDLRVLVAKLREALLPHTAAAAV